MKVFRGLPQPHRRFDCAVAIGNFDGVHRGHQALLQQVVQAAEMRGLMPCLITFEPHPKEYFSGNNPMLPRVSNLRDKVLDVGACGIQRLFILNFNERLSSMSPREFCQEILVNGLHVRWVCVGEDFHFGHMGSGNVQTLQELGRELGFEVWIMPNYFHNQKRISSTRLRQTLKQGDMFELSQLLGHHYHITGRIIHGQKLGRQLGFPTINMDALPVDKNGVPALDGVFAVFVHGLTPYPLAGVASVTCRPTITGQQEKKYLLETHIFDYSGNCYGHLARIEFIEKLRDNQKFADLEELKSAINHDAQTARQILGLAKSDDLITQLPVSL